MADQKGNIFLTFLDDAFKFEHQRDLATNFAEPSLDTPLGGEFWDLLQNYRLKSLLILFWSPGLSIS